MISPLTDDLAMRLSIRSKTSELFAKTARWQCSSVASSPAHITRSVNFMSCPGGPTKRAKRDRALQRGVHENVTINGSIMVHINHGNYKYKSKILDVSSWFPWKWYPQTPKLIWCLQWKMPLDDDWEYPPWLRKPPYMVNHGPTSETRKLASWSVSTCHFIFR